MARSQLLKDLVSGNTDIESILLRLKVILNDIGNPIIHKWIDGELSGYDNNLDELPDYRKCEGQLLGTFIVNGSTKYTNASMPIEHLLSAEKIENLRSVLITDAISIVSGWKTSGSNISRPFPTTFCHGISTYELQIIRMEATIPINKVEGIVVIVKKRLVEIILELEKKFVNIDDLDLSINEGDEQAVLKDVEKSLIQIIYQNNPISIGNQNRIGKSFLGNIFGNKDED